MAMTVPPTLGTLNVTAYDEDEDEDEFLPPPPPSAHHDNGVALALLEAIEKSQAAVEVFDLKVLKKLVLSFEHRLKDNIEARLKYPDHPEKFADFRNRPSRRDPQAQDPRRRPRTHVLEDNDEPAQALVDALIENNVLELLVQNLLRLSENDPDEMAAICSTLATIEDLIEMKPAVTEMVCEKTKLIRWLLGKIKAVAMYKSQDLTTLDEEEMVENLFDYLCCLLMPLENERFLKAEGVELMVIIVVVEIWASKPTVNIARSPQRSNGPCPWITARSRKDRILEDSGRSIKPSIILAKGEEETTLWLWVSSDEYSDGGSGELNGEDLARFHGSFYLGQEGFDVVGLLQDLTDEDVLEDNDEPAQALFDALIENNVLELLVQNLLRLSENDPDEMTGIYITLTTIENSIEVKPALAEMVCEKTKLVRWLLGKIKLDAYPYASIAMSGSPPTVAPCPSPSAVIILSLLNSDSLEVTMALARTAIVFGNDYSELPGGGSPSLLCSDSLANTSALARSDSVFV
ncbi:ARM repeat superfamily protein [Actinidia rufa]|uniref:ARM repeat superfamily protein n=1 Tax=Actinidia rufa TaxID=165716 RepID=A0A7J0DHG4_9ERIC|nr:ARM repeat superfamily protein [Actinidia rufa]